MPWSYLLVAIARDLMRPLCRDDVLGLFFFQAEDGIRDDLVTGVQTCDLPISSARRGFAGSMYTPGASCAAPSGRARRASSCCCASAVAAVTESAVLSMRVSETELTAKPPTAMPIRAIVPSASRSELPRVPRWCIVVAQEQGRYHARPFDSPSLDGDGGARPRTTAHGCGARLHDGRR